mgnify:CR=1 FL=1
MARFSSNQLIGIALLIAVLLIWVPFSIPFINQVSIGALIVVVIGVWHLFR